MKSGLRVGDLRGLLFLAGLHAQNMPLKIEDSLIGRVVREARPL